MKKRSTFLLGVMLIYILIFFLNRPLFISSLKFSFKTFKRVALVFLSVIPLLILLNYYFEKKLSHIFNSKKKHLFILSIIAGIISSGPVYAYYPLLSNLKKKGIKPRYIAAFLYARSIKVPLFPFLIYYFGITYLLLLTSFTIIFSIIDSLLLEKLLGVKG